MLERFPAMLGAFLVFGLTAGCIDDQEFGVLVDLDADGFDDFAVSSADDGAGGQVHIVYGRSFAPASMNLAEVSVLVDGSDSGGGFGTNVSALGDVNGDMYADFLVSAPLVDGVGPLLDVGEAYLFLGMGL